MVFASLLLAYSLGAPVLVTWDASIREDAARSGYTEWLNDHAPSAAAAASRALGLRLDRPLKVTVHSAEAYARRFGRGMGDFAWAHYYRGEVHINGGLPIRRSFVGLLHHEMTHAVLDATGRARALPRWLNEGLAEVVEASAMGRRGIDQVQRLYLKDGLRDGDLPTLARMGAPKDGNQYLQCQAAVSFAFKSFGRSTVLAVVRDGLETGRFEAAWESATSTTLDRFDHRFREWIADFDG